MTTRVEIRRLGGFHMEAQNEQGNTVQLDASPDVGGRNMGMRPMQLLLAALGSCSAIDVINILRKQRQPLIDLSISVTGKREDKVPAVYTEAHIHFRLHGSLDPDKVAKAIALSVEKYCSVVETLKPTATITHSFEITL